MEVKEAVCASERHTFLVVDCNVGPIAGMRRLDLFLVWLCVVNVDILHATAQAV